MELYVRSMKQIQATCVKAALWFSIEGVLSALGICDEESKKDQRTFRYRKEETVV